MKENNDDQPKQSGRPVRQSGVATEPTAPVELVLDSDGMRLSDPGELSREQEDQIIGHKSYIKPIERMDV